jgi:Flp pilus assembly protein TadG
MRWRPADGSVTTELVLITPILLVLLGFVMFAGRLGGVQQRVLSAADEGARAASLRGDPDAGRSAAIDAVETNLGDAGVECLDLMVEVGTDDFARGGQVTVTVRCAVGLDDVVFAGLPGSRAYEASATEVIDLWRGGD